MKRNILIISFLCMSSLWSRSYYDLFKDTVYTFLFGHSYHSFQSPTETSSYVASKDDADEGISMQSPTLPLAPDNFSWKVAYPESNKTTDVALKDDDADEGVFMQNSYTMPQQKNNDDFTEHQEGTKKRQTFDEIVREDYNKRYGNIRHRVKRDDSAISDVSKKSTPEEVQEENKAITQKASLALLRKEQDTQRLHPLDVLHQNTLSRTKMTEEQFKDAVTLCCDTIRIAKDKNRVEQASELLQKLQNEYPNYAQEYIGITARLLPKKISRIKNFFNKLFE